jgi:two-component system C4-dicarboxylate transport sensor histidine kinase DctB
MRRGARIPTIRNRPPNASGKPFSMSADAHALVAPRDPPAPLLPVRAVLRYGAAIAVCIAIGASAYHSFFAAQLDAQREAATRRLEFFAQSLEALLDRNEALPGLLALEGKLGALLDADTPATRDAANHHLEAVTSISHVSATYLMNDKGLTLAASNWSQPVPFVGRNYAFRPYFQEAAAGRIGRFYGVGVTTGEAGYFLATGLRSATGARGVIAVKLSLDSFEHAMRQSGEAVLIADRDGVVFLSAVPEWKYRVLEPLSEPARERIETTQQYGNQALQPLSAAGPVRADGAGQRLVRGDVEGRHSVTSQTVGGLGWRMMLLADQQEPRRAALAVGVAAALAAAFAIGVVMHMDLTRRRRAERLAADARLREVHESLERRIAARTGELEHKVAELKRTEAILRETRDSAVQAGKLAVLGQMSAGMSHELNQPLAALHTLSDNAITLLEHERVAETKENLALIGQLAARMGRIVTQLKAFARKDAAVLGPVSVAQAVEHALIIVEPRRAELHARIVVEPVASSVLVHADATRLEQVLVNLLRNGLDEVATQQRRELQVSATRSGRHVSIRIRDFGHGIAPEVLPHLFEPFYTTKPVGQGLGLGLALSLTIIETFGGSLEARNAQGGGAEFSIWLDAT